MYSESIAPVSADLLHSDYMAAFSKNRVASTFSERFPDSSTGCAIASNKEVPSHVHSLGQESDSIMVAPSMAVMSVTMSVNQTRCSESHHKSQR